MVQLSCVVICICKDCVGVCVCRLTEGERLNKVLDHPAFQADPIGSIFQHLQSQQPPVEEKPKKKTNTNGSKKRNRKKGKAESMDF